MSEKRVLIPWSGGADSTLLMAQAMRAKHRIWYCSLATGQPQTQQEAEAAARGVLLDKLRSRYDEAPEVRQCESLLKMDTSPTRLPMKQMPGWFMHLITMVGNGAGQYVFDEVHLGYLLNDDGAYACSDLSRAWYHLCRAIYGLDEDPPKLKFPLLRYRKGDVLYDLKNAGLFDYVSVCELPQRYDDGWRACGQCPSCYKHKSAIAETEMHRSARYLGNLLIDYDHRTKRDAVQETIDNTYVKSEELQSEQTS